MCCTWTRANLGMGWDFLRRLVGKTSELEVVEEKEREEAALT